MEASLFFCSKCGSPMKPFIGDPDLMVCEQCNTVEDSEDLELLEGYDPVKYVTTVEFIEKLSPQSIAMMLMDCGAAIEKLETSIKVFLEAWQVHTELEGKHIVLRVPGYGERLGTEYGFDRDDDDGQWGKRGAALFALWRAVQDV